MKKKKDYGGQLHLNYHKTQPESATQFLKERLKDEKNTTHKYVSTWNLSLQNMLRDEMSF